jgi:N-hydroxyarylamine O-acetyltransferase
MIDLDAYFRRIGYQGPRAPTLNVLRAIHARHPAAIPYEGIDVLLGRPVDIAPDAIFDKLVRRGRGGYCFEQNGLFKAVLVEMGYAVEAFLGRVLWFLGPDAPLPLRTHMAMRVTIDGQAWLADVGFGGTVMSAPLLMTEFEPQTTPNGVYRLTPIGNELKLEILSPSGWKPMVLIALQPQLDVDFIAPNWFTSTHPRSIFRNRLMACRATAEARYSLIDNRLTVRKSDGEWAQETLDRAALEATLHDVFAVDVTEEVRAAIGRVVWGLTPREQRRVR